MYSPELGKTLTERAERGGCVYDLSRPAEEVVTGALVELIDFHNSARSIGSGIALGTRVFKEVIREMTSDSVTDQSTRRFDDNLEDPFLHVHRLPGSQKGLTIWTQPTITMKLDDFYIRSQELKDFYESLTDAQKLIMFAKKGSLVVRDVIYDDGELFEAKEQPL